MTDFDGMDAAHKAATAALEAALARGRPGVTVDMVREEASRRILDRYPDWRQRNMTARGLELLRARQDRPLSADEAAEEAGIEAAWAWIKSQRQASTLLEAMVPVPDDFRDARHWP